MDPDCARCSHGANYHDSDVCNANNFNCACSGYVAKPEPVPLCPEGKPYIRATRIVTVTAYEHGHGPTCIHVDSDQAPRRE